MLKVGVRAHDFGRQSAESLPRAIRAVGFEAVQLALTKAIDGVDTFTDVTPGILENVRRSFAANGIEISILGCYIEPAHPDREARLRHVENFKLGLEHARALGVSIAGTETTHLAPDTDHGRREELYQSLKDSVLRMAEKAEALGVDIGIEPVAVHTLNTPELARRLLDEVGSGRVRIIFDPVNMLLPGNVGRQEEVYADFLRLLGRDIRIAHMKDIVYEGGEQVWRGIGRGMVHHRFVTDWLRGNAPDVPLLREDARAESFVADLVALRALA